MNSINSLVLRIPLLFILFVTCSVNVFGIDLKDTRMLTQPAISAKHLAFIYAEDLWIANLDGSQPKRLTHTEGLESNPAFSPDGKLIAYSAKVNGNVDVYVIPVNGGTANRLTWHPAEDVVRGFTPDGRSVLFASQRTTFTKTITSLFSQLFTVPVMGGAATSIDIPSAHHASYSPNGQQIAYTPVPDAFKQWKHYRGGQTAQIWLFSFTDQSILKIPKLAGGSNDTQPIWTKDAIYFRSDRNGEFNLYVYNVKKKLVSQLTDFKDFPVLNASYGNGQLIFERAGYLYIYNPALKTYKKLVIAIQTDLPELKPRLVQGANYIRSADISSAGFAAFDFRGEIVTISTENGSFRNRTNTPGAHDKFPSWSADGHSIAYFSDSDGEYKLTVSSEKGSLKSYKLAGTGFYNNPKWSPDQKKISYSDNGRNLYVLDIASGEVQKINTDELYELEAFRDFSGNWSPDSKWIVYTKVLNTHFKQILIYSVDQHKSYPVTDGMSDATEPQFSRDGAYLCFLASTDAGPLVNWFDQSNLESRKTSSIYLLALQKSSFSPLGKGFGENNESIPGKVKQVSIDWEGIQNRLIPVPVRPGNYSQLRLTADGRILYMEYPENASGKMHAFNLSTRIDAEVMDMESYLLSPDGKKMLYKTGDSWIVSAAGQKPEGKGTLDIKSISIKIDPAAEWANILDEAWRVQRDYFYDPGMHGADWPAIKKKYEAFLPDLTCRSDLNLLLQWMGSELSVGHSFILDEGDKLFQPETINVGLLGADYTIANNRYRFKKIYGRLDWNPDLKTPLTEPGINLSAGDYLLAVNGKDIRAAKDLYQYFVNTANVMVELTVGPNADYTGSRKIKVVPVDNEYDLRNRTWVEENLKKVTAATNGQVAYVYVPNTHKQGLDYFKRYFYPQANRKAIIIDERFNGGGFLADYYINLLKNPYQANWKMRYGQDMKSPSASIQGPKVMLINESAGSGGDMLPWMFRKFNMGTLVGTRTWGGFVGVLGTPELLDGGMMTAPDLGVYTKDGWQIENEGIQPDVEIEQLPAEVIRGNDPQLQKAIEIALKELERNPPVEVIRPAYPIKVKK